MPTSAEIEHALAAVYARPEFAAPSSSPLARLIGDVWGWMRRLLAELFQAVRTESGFANWLMLGALVVVTVWIALHLVRHTRNARHTRSHAWPSPASTAPLAQPSHAESWERAAAAAAAAQRWREAALALYQTVVLGLAEGGALHYDAAKTPGDYRREIRREQRAAAAFDAFLRIFEPIAYGRRETGPADFEGLRAAAAEVAGRA